MTYCLHFSLEFLFFLTFMVGLALGITASVVIDGKPNKSDTKVDMSKRSAPPKPDLNENK